MNTTSKLLALALVAVSQVTNAQSFEWVKQLGATNEDHGQSIGIDGSGNVYTAGMFRGTVDFDPGPGTFNLTAIGTDDIFISKMDAAGNFVWAKRMGNTNYNLVSSMAVDNDGNVYLTGRFEGTVDFDPGAGTFNITSTVVNNFPTIDVYVSKLNASGDFVWAKHFGGTEDNYSYSIAVDGSGNVYTTGYFLETADFDPGAGTFNLFAFASSPDIFISKLDASGNFVMAVSFGGTGLDFGHSIAVDDDGNIYTTGYFMATVDFDPGGGVSNLTTVGDHDIFVSKLSPFGSFIWAKQFGSTDTDEGNSIAVDGDGNVYTTGFYRGTADFDPGAGTFNLLPAGISGYDVFVSKLDASGHFVWAKRLGGTNNEVGNSITLDGSGNIYTTGYFRGTADFNPGSGTFNLTTNGIEDVFISKLDASGNFSWALKFGGTSGNDAANSIVVDGSQNIYTTGYFEATAEFDPGPLSAFVTSTGSSDCFIHKLSQCTNSTGTDIQTACNSYTWIDGNTYTASNNTAMYTLSNAGGCDSIVTLNLTINSVADVTTTTNVLTISANNTGATYQWLNCDNNYAELSGETGQNFTATSNGNYAVELTQNSCVDTSNCVEITSVGILENSFGSQLSLYPNPSNGNFSIDLGAVHGSIAISISDVAGSLISSTTMTRSQILNLSIEEPAGVYFISVQTDDETAVMKVIKE